MRSAAPLAIVFALAASACVRADVIVLKNGNRIVAEAVTTDADQVTYQTYAGQLSIPKAIVARIIHNDAGYFPPGDSAPPVSAPQVEPAPGYEKVTRLTIHDGGVDYAYIRRLELEARTGAPSAINKVAAAHYAAAQFFLSKGNSNYAIQQYQQGLTYAPNNLGLLLNLAVLYLRGSEFTAALGPLRHAHDIYPNSPDVDKLMGWAYYGANRTDQAIAEWKVAAKLRPDPDVLEALHKAEQDQALEANYREGQTLHFDLKYYGGATPELARGILSTLESDYSDLESQLDYNPPEQIGVILYTDQTFKDITRAPSWVGALNDGRIRIPVQGLTSVTPELAHVLKHELTHSFVGQKSHYRAPTWLQEGLAQWMEGKRSGPDAAALVRAASQGFTPSLGSLEGSWMGLTGNSASLAYAWSLAVVESMINRDGMGQVSRLLGRLATAPSAQDAVQETLDSNYDEIQQQAVDYLQTTYLNGGN